MNLHGTAFHCQSEANLLCDSCPVAMVYGKSCCNGLCETLLGKANTLNYYKVILVLRLKPVALSLCYVRYNCAVSLSVKLVISSVTKKNLLLYYSRPSNR